MSSLKARPGTLVGDTQMVALMLGISTRHVRRMAQSGAFKVVGYRATGKQGRPALMFNLRQASEAWQQHKQLP